MLDTSISDIKLLRILTIDTFDIRSESSEIGFDILQWQRFTQYGVLYSGVAWLKPKGEQAPQSNIYTEQIRAYVKSR